MKRQMPPITQRQKTSPANKNMHRSRWTKTEKENKNQKIKAGTTKASTFPAPFVEPTVKNKSGILE